MENLKEWARKQKMDKWILEEQKRNRLAYEFKQEAKKRFPDLYPDTKDQVCKC